MPSPLGHALGGLLAGGLLAPEPSAASAAHSPPARRAEVGRVAAWLDDRRHWWGRQAVVFGALGAMADLDFLIDRHNYESHSVGAAVLVAAIAWLITRGRLRWALAAAAAYGSHIVLDWLGSDTVPPIGVMALWPFSGDFYQSDRHWFMAIWREVGRAGFVAHNLQAVLREVALLGPFVGLIWRWRARRGAPAGAERAQVARDARADYRAS